MKCLVFLVSTLLGFLPICAAEKALDLTFQITPEIGSSFDTATICRVSVTNYSGDPLDGRRVGFEASALENGVVVERERGRFRGMIGNGETAETLIGFNGVFRSFEIAAAPVSSRSRSGGAGRGAKGSSKTASSKASGKRRPRKTN
ncbi:MAG: hypothetical protein ACRD16_06090 [Thermoanaerobaculia bacterium]